MSANKERTLGELILGATTGWGGFTELDPAWFLVEKQNFQILHVCRFRFWTEAMKFATSARTGKDFYEPWEDWENLHKHIGWINLDEEKCKTCESPVPENLLAYARLLAFREKMNVKTDTQRKS